MSESEVSFLGAKHNSVSFERIPSTKQNNRNKLKKMATFCRLFWWYVWRWTCHVPIKCVLFCVIFFGLEFWPNYTGLHCLVSNACDGKHVYIVFFFIIYFCIFYWFWKERWTLFTYSGLIGFDNGGEKVFGAPLRCVLNWIQ
jgi:hypothetical protein